VFIDPYWPWPSEEEEEEKEELFLSPPSVRTCSIPTFFSFLELCLFSKGGPGRDSEKTWSWSLFISHQINIFLSFFQLNTKKKEKKRVNNKKGKYSLINP